MSYPKFCGNIANTAYYTHAKSSISHLKAQFTSLLH